MSASVQDLADYLSRCYPEWGRSWNAWAGYREERYPWLDRPTDEQVAANLLNDAVFAGFDLGRLFGTPQGEFIAAAVEQVSPPFLRQDEELLVAGLKLAVKLQSEGKQRAAGELALGVLVGAVFAGLLFLAANAGGS